MCIFYVQEPSISMDPYCTHINSTTINSTDDVEYPLDLGIEPCVTYSIKVDVISVAGLTPGLASDVMTLTAGMYEVLQW